MVSRESVSEVFLPDKEDCLEYLAGVQKGS
jgi:hypothetical protein